MKILVTGKHGQLASEIYRNSDNYSDYSFTFLSKKDLDVTNELLCEKYFSNNYFDFIINCAAYTKVDESESNLDLAMSVNSLAVKILSKICKNYSTGLIHISTDYVFDGSQKSPINELEMTNPINNYGSSKLSGENEMIRINPSNSIIIRTSWLYSKFRNNFFKTILKFSDKDNIKIINDQLGSPTNAYDLANDILKIIDKISNKNVEIYHYSNTGECSWYEFAKLIKQKFNLTFNIIPIKSEDYHFNTPRPDYSVLNSDKFQSKFGLNINNWKNSFLNKKWH